MSDPCGTSRTISLTVSMAGPVYDFVGALRARSLHSQACARSSARSPTSIFVKGIFLLASARHAATAPPSRVTDSPATWILPGPANGSTNTRPAISSTHCRWPGGIRITIGASAWEPNCPRHSHLGRVRQSSRGTDRALWADSLVVCASVCVLRDQDCLAGDSGVLVVSGAVESATTELFGAPRKAFEPPCSVTNLNAFLGRPAFGFWSPMSPLFEMERDVVHTALITERTYPIRMCWAGFAPTLAARDDPANLTLLEPTCEVDG